MVRIPTLRKPRISTLRKDAPPLQPDQVRCACGKIISADANGIYVFPAECANHPGFSYNRCFPRGDDGRAR